MKTLLQVLFGIAMTSTLLCCTNAACPSGQVALDNGGQQVCKQSCEKNEDCGQGEICHTDDDKPHCDPED